MHSNICKPSTTCIIIAALIVILLPIIIYLIYICSTTPYKTPPKPPIEAYSNDLFDNIKSGKENDFWVQTDAGMKAKDCYGLPRNECLRYSNCGICMKNGRSECMPGDEQGPFFKEDCQGWAYSNVYDRYIFGERVTTVTPPWSMFYPDYEQRTISPVVASTLQ